MSMTERPILRIDGVASMSLPDIAKAYCDDGYVVCERLFSDDELAALKEDLVKLARGYYPCESLQPIPDSVSDEDALVNILCIHFPHHASPVVKAFTQHEKLARVLSQIVGAHLADGHWNGGVKCMQSMFFAKPSGKPGQAWHQDELYIPTRDRSLCGAWIAVDDATLENGCLWVIPGSHKSGVLYPQKPHGRNDEFDASNESYGFDESLEIPVEVPAGSVVFFNGYLLHRSKRNTSSGYRRALVNHYMSMNSLLPWWVGDNPPQYVSGASDCRCVHPVVGEDPYAGAGYEVPKDAVYLRGYGD